MEQGIYPLPSAVLWFTMERMRPVFGSATTTEPLSRPSASTAALRTTGSSPSVVSPKVESAYVGVTHGLYRALDRRDRERETAAVVLFALLDAVAFRAVTVRRFADVARLAVVFFFTVLFFAVSFFTALFFTTVAFLTVVLFLVELAFFAVLAGWAAELAAAPTIASRKRMRANRAKNIMFKPSANGNPNITKMLRIAVSVFSTDQAGNVKAIRAVENHFRFEAEYHAGTPGAIADRWNGGPGFNF